MLSRSACDEMACDLVSAAYEDAADDSDKAEYCRNYTDEEVNKCAADSDSDADMLQTLTLTLTLTPTLMPTPIRVGMEQTPTVRTRVTSPETTSAMTAARAVPSMRALMEQTVPTAGLGLCAPIRAPLQAMATVTMALSPTSIVQTSTSKG